MSTASRVSDLALVAAHTPNRKLRRRMARSASMLILADQSSMLDKAQVGLDVAGVVPGVGEIFDFINVCVSLARGDVMGAALSAMSIVPVVGDAVGKSGKVALWVSKLSKQEGRLGKATQYIVKNGPKLKAALQTFSKTLLKYRQEILGVIQTLNKVVSLLVNPPEEGEDDSTLAKLTSTVSKNPKVKAVAQKAAPALKQLNVVMLNMMQVAQGADQMFARLEERAQQEAAGAAA